jgi:hypothetical protein
MYIKFGIFCHELTRDSRLQNQTIELLIRSGKNALREKKNQLKECNSLPDSSNKKKTGLSSVP